MVEKLYYEKISEIFCFYCEKCVIIPNWNNFFEKSSPFAKKICIYTASMIFLKYGDFRPKTANLGNAYLEQSNFL